MGKEIIQIAEALSNERAIPQEKIFEALEMALATATKKKYPVDIAVRVAIDRKNGSYETFRRWTVVDTDGPLENPASEVSLEAARVDHPDIQPGDVVEEEIPSVEFDRITIQTAKQVLSQKVRDAEREQIIAEQRDRVGHVVNATVKKQNHEIMVIDLGNNAESVMKRDQIIPHETYGRGDRIKVLLQEIRNDPGKGPQIICTRTSNDFLKELFRIEVLERYRSDDMDIEVEDLMRAFASGDLETVRDGLSQYLEVLTSSFDAQKGKEAFYLKTQNGRASSTRSRKIRFHVHPHHTISTCTCFPQNAMP